MVGGQRVVSRVADEADNLGRATVASEDNAPPNRVRGAEDPLRRRPAQHGHRRRVSVIALVEEPPLHQRYAQRREEARRHHAVSGTRELAGLPGGAAGDVDCRRLIRPAHR